MVDEREGESVAIDISLKMEELLTDVPQDLTRFANVDGLWIHILKADRIPWFVVFDMLESAGVRLVPAATHLAIDYRDLGVDCKGWVVTHVGHLLPQNPESDFAIDFPEVPGGYVDWETELVIDEDQIFGNYGIIAVNEAYVALEPIAAALGNVQTRSVRTVYGEQSDYVRVRPIASSSVLDPASVAPLPHLTPPRVAERTFYLAKEGAEIPEEIRADTLGIGYLELRHPWTVGLQKGEELAREFGEQLGLLPILGSSSNTGVLIRDILSRAAKLGG